MSDISGLVSSDSRRPIERLRRCKLWQLADARGIQYPSAAPKEEMIKILEGNGIDVTKDAEWNQVLVQDERGAQHVELYPKEEVHASATKNIDYAQAIEKAAVDYSTMKRPDLMKTCKEHGVKFTMKDKNVDLIEKLSGR